MDEINRYRKMADFVCYNCQNKQFPYMPQMWENCTCFEPIMEFLQEDLSTDRMKEDIELYNDLERIYEFYVRKSLIECPMEFQ